VTNPASYNTSGYYNSRVIYIYEIHKNLVPIKMQLQQQFHFRTL